jgi:hypothetical protein
MFNYGEFSEFECRKLAMKFKDDENYQEAGAIGSVEESMNTKTVTKKYMGVEKKTRTKGTGAGELKLSLHMNYERYKKTYGMNLDGLEDGVAAYGSNSVHPEFGIVMETVDEDENVKYKAYPNCVVKDGIARKIENGGEDVAEIEMTVAVMPDETGNGMYEALESKLSQELKGKWMTEFTPDLVKAKEL